MVAFFIEQVRVTKKSKKARAMYRKANPCNNGDLYLIFFDCLCFYFFLVYLTNMYFTSSISNKVVKWKYFFAKCLQYLRTKQMRHVNIYLPVFVYFHCIGCLHPKKWNSRWSLKIVFQFDNSRAQIVGISFKNNDLFARVVELSSSGWEERVPFALRPTTMKNLHFLHVFYWKSFLAK